MATVIREYQDENGRQLREYESGTVLDAQTGKIVSAKPVFNSDNARDMVALRVAKTERLIRERIKDASNSAGLGLDARSAPEAVAVAAGVLWETVVLNPDERGRDRVDAWERIGRAGAVLADPKKTQQSIQEQAQALGGAVGAALHAIIAAEIQRRQGDG